MKIKENKTVHCIGNGRICAYAKGVDLFQIFGPNYSCPVGCNLLFSNSLDFSYQQTRIKSTDIWKYSISLDGCELGNITDFSHTFKAAIFRTINFKEPAEFFLNSEKIEKFYEVPQQAAEIENFFMGEIAEGEKSYIYSINGEIWRGFVLERPVYFGMVCIGDLKAEQHSDKSIKIKGRHGGITLFYAYNFDEILRLAKEFSDRSWDTYYDERVSSWQCFSHDREKNTDLPDSKLKDIFDDIYVLMKTQQSVSGGILAGYPYHLAYIRDSYGINRGLLALGAFEESKKLIEFYMNVFEKYGCIHNAQGTDAYAFHIHENDKSEITAYMVLMILDYVFKTGDKGLLLKSKALILWCILEQHSILKNGMLPFNGDETYIAGFILPREIINHGSMEATMLYHKCCKGLLELKDDLAFKKEEISLLKEDISSIEGSFKKNFFVNGRLACNNPDYYNEATEPKFRTGIRLCGHGMGIGVLNKNHRYVCFDCYSKEDYTNDSFYKRYFIQSPLLMAIYVQTDLIEKEILDHERELIAKQIIENEYGCSIDKTVGYDLGIAIFALKDSHPELISKLKQSVIDMRDSCGTWSEYYENRLPTGTMYRPWESGINLESLMVK